jgi:2,4-dienoyl-CoA reductase (NADPH2)
MVGGDMPLAMTEEEIEAAIQSYADGARRAKEAGFDGVEVHAAHGYLISEFLSPKTNKRTDKWGGSFENRCSFAVQVVRRIRSEVGNFPLLYRFSAEESTPNSLTLEEGVAYAKILEHEGVDCFDVTHGDYESIKHFPMQGNPKDQLVYLA